MPRALAATGHRAMIYREPYGVTLVIGPFNGPLTLLIRPAIAVLAAGNPCILKPSEALAATSALLARLVPEYFDPRAVCVVAADREKGAQLLDLPFDFLFFTGSTRTGKVMARAAAENLTPMLLELGGINPALVDETANLPDAAKKIVWGAMAWGGQWCTSPGYAYVHESVAEEFVSQSAQALVSLYGRDPRNNPDYSRIISEHDVLRLAALIDPGKVIAGGRSEPEARYLDPTILYPVSWDDKIMEDEIFGPVLPVITYRTFDEALSKIAAQTTPARGVRVQPRPDGSTGLPDSSPGPAPPPSPHRPGRHQHRPRRHRPGRHQHRPGRHRPGRHRPGRHRHRRPGQHRHRRRRPGYRRGRHRRRRAGRVWPGYHSGVGGAGAGGHRQGRGPAVGPGLAGVSAAPPRQLGPPGWPGPACRWTSATPRPFPRASATR